jgi:hypothetical protein
VVDAVNALHAKLSNSCGSVHENHTHLVFDGDNGSYFTFPKTRPLKKLNAICTIEEFNRCVKDMSHHAGIIKFGFYINSEKTPLEPIKLRMRVEYVKVEDSIFHLHDDLISGQLYWKDTDDSYKVISKRKHHCIENDFSAAFMGDNLYRKVETEITWQGELKFFMEKSEFIDGDIYVDRFFVGSKEEIKELIEMCHIVSSMNK